MMVRSERYAVDSILRRGMRLCLYEQVTKCVCCLARRGPLAKSNVHVRCGHLSWAFGFED